MIEYDLLVIQELVCFYFESEFKNVENISFLLFFQLFGFDVEFYIFDDEYVFLYSDVFQKEFEDI